MIKATFPEGVTAMTVNGLHQWDYGQQLQIQASGLPAIVEVHFACDGMNEAVVRSCAVTSGTLTAAIPDICLEQTSPVMAWVYIVGGSSGITTLTVTLPIIARARPQPNATIPEDTSDKYTEAIAAMNTAVNNMSTGNFTAARAISDAEGHNISDTYALKSELLTVDILTKAGELISLGGCRVERYYITDGYPTDSTGNPVNLPSGPYKYSHAVIMTHEKGVTVYLFPQHGVQPICYNHKNINVGTWDGWKSIVDSSNIGGYTAKAAQFVPVAVTIKVDTNQAQYMSLINYNLVYYRMGERTSISSSVEKGTSKQVTIAADLGSCLYFGNNNGDYNYDEDAIPLVAKKSMTADCDYTYKNSFIVIGGGAVTFSITDKG